MKAISSILLITCLTVISCSVTRTSLPNIYPAFLKEGHRGTRGLMPENTIPAMIKGIETGADIIEVDVYTSKDGKVIISHDPYVNIKHTLDANGREISKEDAKKYVFHQMNYEDIRKFDVGSKTNSQYPKQQKIAAHIPLLSELIDSVEAFTRANSRKPAIYNIELKNTIEYDGLGYNAKPSELVDAVMDVVKSKNIGNRFYIQSFDYRPLQYARKAYPKVILGFLTNDKKLTFEDQIKTLGFYPNIYSPYYGLVNEDLVKKCHTAKIKLVPWTVNTGEEMKKLIAMGVDGIITDYPDTLSMVAPR